MNNNPYQSPASTVDNDITSYPRKRNAWIWIIIVYQSLSIIGMTYSFVVLRGGYIPIPKELQQYYDNLGVFDWTLQFIAFAIVLLSIIFLFRLSKLAVRFFVAEMALSIFMFILNYFRHNALSTHHGLASSSGAILGYSILILIIAYLFKLQKRGVLQ